MSSEEIHHANYTQFENLAREETLQRVVDSYLALADGQDNWVCNLANASSLLWHAYRSMPLDINWAGFYVTKDPQSRELILGPFQGKVACQLIKSGSGVCGTALLKKETQLVANVNQFPGHIACDGETKSEIVVPIVSSAGHCLGVIDIDCLAYNGFSEIDQHYLEKLAAAIVQTCKFN
ncbi:LANO_0E13630g1_1 [Lachancea nothofagi CBS 11611]|uniref:LANO_0E13630g1_1 n=1 Tax=Lachancea nothofagi CBS 11611 TaxID=1266666 RepID=A0A1G4JZ63_9SACH|nr:LANO_0E13630g1_1 [Lachancea nothofagi CBS 11611]